MKSTIFYIKLFLEFSADYILFFYFTITKDDQGFIYTYFTLKTNKQEDNSTFQVSTLIGLRIMFLLDISKEIDEFVIEIRFPNSIPNMFSRLIVRATSTLLSKKLLL